MAPGRTEKIGAELAELILEDGTRLPGRRFGGARDVAGEVVFSTGMVGYVESLTDPSYRGQILALTYPLQGNYGVPTIDAVAMESRRVQPQALVVGRAAKHPCHPTSTRTLHDWLSSEGVAGIEGVDTRALTQRLREHGTMRGWIVDAGLDDAALIAAKASAHAVDDATVAQQVAPTEIARMGTGDLRILLVDSGVKEGIARSLVERGTQVIRVGFQQPLAALVASERVDAIVLGNGPGDPKALGDYIGQTRTLLDLDKPIFGICLGHQILALAAGGETYKLRFGHRSQNQPVRDVDTQRCFLTSQNHGYAVDDAIPRGFRRWFENLNDGTNEGMRHETRRVRSVQFHPEAAPGPEDTRFLFDEFLAEVRVHVRIGARR